MKSCQILFLFFFSFFTLKMLDLFSQFWNPEPFTIADAMRTHKPSGSGVEIAVFTRYSTALTTSLYSRLRSGSNNQDVTERALVSCAPVLGSMVPLCKPYTRLNMMHEINDTRERAEHAHRARFLPSGPPSSAP